MALACLIPAASARVRPPVAQEVLHAALNGQADARGSAADPLTFGAALDRLSARLRAGGPPDGGHLLIVRGGRYPVTEHRVLGPEFSGSAERPIVIRAAEGEQVTFHGGIEIPNQEFGPVEDPRERARLAAGAVDRSVVATIRDFRLLATLRRKVVTTLAIDDRIFLPAVFPNDGYANLADETAEPEISPPAVPPGKQGYGVRAGHPPYQEEGRRQGWLGSIEAPRGAWARIDGREEEMAGSWAQWETELARNPHRSLLTGYIEANWLLRSQPVIGASAATRSLHLSQALSYGWMWKNRDKPFRLFGLLCEMDRPGEWHFDTLTDRLFLIPPRPFSSRTRVQLPVADGFLTLDRTRHVELIGLDVENLGSGYAYRLEGGHDNLIAGATIRNSTAGGVWLGGRNDRVRGCDLIDLERHVRLGGGRRGEELLEQGGNSVENCHVYQRGFSHLKVSIGVSGVGNTLRNNLVHHSIGQAVTVHGNDHMVEKNELFNIGYDEGDGGAIYSGGDLIGYGNTYRHNFIHHLMHVPGKVERSGIHLDDCQAGSTCVGNVFFKSAAKGIFMYGGAGHTLLGNVFLEGSRGIYNDGNLGARHHQWEQEIAADPGHEYRNTKENYLGRAERSIGKEGWLREPWKSRFPLMVRVLEDRGEFGRMWPIRCRVEDNLFFANQRGDRTIWGRMDPAVRAKSVIRGDRVIDPDVFVDYESMDFRFREEITDLPEIPFAQIGLQVDGHRPRVPDPSWYRPRVKAFFEGIPSMPGTRKQLDSARLIESAPMR